jgi:sporulation protein YlmC with PRC-barrel domain
MTQAGSDDRPAPAHPLIESNRVEGTPVYDPSAKRIGTIHHLIIEKVSGRVVYAVMSFGGFLRMGARTHAIPWEKLRYGPQLGGCRTDITREQLTRASQAYGDEEVWRDRRREKDVRDH